MEQATRMGANRTGIDTSPILTKEMLTGMEEFLPQAGDGNEAFAAIEGQYIDPSVAVGSVPLPGTLKGAMKSMAKKLTGHNSAVFINKLGERLAYERSGVRLYEAFIRKCEALMSATPLMPMQDLWEIRNEEEQHFLLIQACMEKLGADPTAQTPDADVIGVASSGIMKVMTDPRTSLSQCLEMLVTIELTDNASWELLMTMSRELGLEDMTIQFARALQHEASHLERVRAWLQATVVRQMKTSLAPMQ